MSAPSLDPADLLDLKLMPAWVKEPSTREDYADYKGEEVPDRPERVGQRPRSRDQSRPKQRRGPEQFGKRERSDRRKISQRKDRGREFHRENRPPPKPEPPLEVAVEFVPRSAVLDNVVGQIKAEALAYSLFFLARSFLEKPQRYEVSLKGKADAALYRLADTEAVSSDRAFLESNAFRLASDKFYRVEVTQSEPLKGNFTSIARCRLSGTMLGPTNHHDYQRRLRGLYEQRFSRRMSFAEYQRQIETVSDPAAVEQWKEQARNVTTFVTLNEEPPITFSSATEAERHFRQNYLPNLVQSASEMTIDGVSSRTLADRRLRSHIEQAWSVENRSPSHMMQALAKRFREVGLHIFRHRRGMLFVSSIRVRPFGHEDESISDQVKAILETVGSTPRIRRKDVAEKLLTDSPEELEPRRLSLASNLKWLISEGYLIEFNDGTLDLPRTKPKKSATAQPETEPSSSDSTLPAIAGGEAHSATESSSEIEAAAFEAPVVDSGSGVAAIGPNRDACSAGEDGKPVEPNNETTDR